MDQKKIDRINELAAIAKKRELTKEELLQRDKLRAEYIQSIRKNIRLQLDSINIKEADGSIHKLRKKNG